MLCKSVARNLDSYRTAELPEDLLEQIRAHLAQCPHCAADLRAIELMAEDARKSRVEAPSGNRKKLLSSASVDSYGMLDTDLGKVWIGFHEGGVTMINLGAQTGQEFEQVYQRRIGRHVRPGTLPDLYTSAVMETLSGKSDPAPPVDLSGLAPFEQEVLHNLLRIPLGEVRTYAWLAREAGRPAAVRAVGNAMARNPVPLLVPCHRVVPSQGGVGNYAFGADMKRELLRREGAPLEELDEMARSGIRFIGSKTTHIFCFPTCRAARLIQDKYRVPFSRVTAAEAAGFRPCRLCRP